MATDTNEQSPATKPGLQLEYNALRSEILKRIEMRQQLTSITLSIAGLFLGFGLNNVGVALIFPLIGFFLASAWAQNDIRIRQLGAYIHERLESEYCRPWLGHLQNTEATKDTIRFISTGRAFTRWYMLGHTDHRHRRWFSQIYFYSSRMGITWNRYSCHILSCLALQLTFGVRVYNRVHWTLVIGHCWLITQSRGGKQSTCSAGRHPTRRPEKLIKLPG